MCKTRFPFILIIVLILIRNGLTRDYVLVAENANKRVLIPTQDIGDSWKSDFQFDDSAWMLCSGSPGGVGYEKGSGYENYITLNVADKMHDGQNPNTSCYIRIRFNPAGLDLANLKSLHLNMRYDDGFVAYLNGRKVVEANAPTSVTWNSAAIEAIESDNVISFDISQHLSSLKSGDNLLAIHGLNVSTASSDFLILPQLSASDSVSVAGDFTSSNLPIIVIDTHGQRIPDEPKITAHMGIIYNGDGVRNHLSDPFNHYNGTIGIELRGNVTQSFPKKPYLIETRDAAGNNLNVSLLGLPSDNDWILLAAYIDKTLLRDPLAFRMSRLMGHWAPRTVFCELVLNKEYQGVYILTEQIKPGKNRVNITKMKATDISGDAVTGGYIYQVSQEEPTFGERRGFVYPKAEDIRPEQVAYIRGYDDNFRKAMSQSTFADSILGYPAWIDDDFFIDEILVQEACKNSDAYGWSSFFHKDRLGKLRAGPVWDFDQALSNSTFNDGPNYAEWIIEKSETDSWLKQNYPPFWIKLFREPNFKKKLIQRWQTLRKGPFHTDSLTQFIDQTAAYLNEAQERNFKKWPVLGVQLWRSTPGWKERNTYQKEVDYLKDFLIKRLNWMDNQLQIDSTSVDGLVAYYKFDEGQGTVVTDFSGNELHGTIIGAAEWTRGKKDGGLLFNGMDSYVNCGNSAKFNLSEQITLAAWVFPLDVANGEDNEWISKGDYAWALKEKGWGAFEFFVYHQGWHEANVALDPHIYNGVWTHFAGTYDGQEIKLYVNGDSVNSLAYVGPIAVTDAAVYLGHNSQVANRYFEGVLDEVMIFNRALTSVEIKNIYESGLQIVAVPEKNVSAITTFALHQNYPNPFNPVTTINYSVATPGWVTIKIYDCLGREIKTLVNANQSIGEHSVIFDATGLASGIYF
ncbi:MAG: CotH kinase family protein, partial [candidate division KSB1 bacterium]|nr:CotH kinase family protein [candidate division KSB1 bacterium]